MKPSSQFPIEVVLPEIQKTLDKHRNLVLTALPGAGKTTRVPLALLHAPWMQEQRMIMLEPRRLAARTAASYMAHTLGEQVGKTVGYRTRMDTCIGPTTRIEVVTQGILTRLLQKDSSLDNYNLVIFDEYHERSLQADLGLALCLQIQEVLREDLRILVMSATLDCKAVSEIMKRAPIITCEGKVFPIETHYIQRMQNSKVEPAIVSCIKQVMRNEIGNILVFLPGAGEIRRVQRLLANANLGTEVRIAPLYGNLSPQTQDQAIQLPPPGIRKIVLATSIAETSLTIQGIRVVIDSGLMRVPRFDARSGMTRLITVKVSQDSADQRRGRAGRLEPGTCYRLWSSIEQQRLLQRTLPEILGADLSHLALELAAWGITDPHTLEWLDPPPANAFAQAHHLLKLLRAVDDQHCITTHGQKMAKLPLHPRLAHMVLRSQELGIERVACDITVILNERDFLKAHSRDRSADLRLRVDLLRTPTTSRHTSAIDRSTHQRVVKVTEQLRTLLGLCENRQDRDSHFDVVGLLLAFAYPDRIAQRQSRQHGHYRLANGKSGIFLESDALVAEDYVVVADLDGTKPHARICLAAPVKLNDLKEQYPELFQNVEYVKWDDQQSAVQAQRQRRLGEIIIDDSPLSETSSPLVTTALLQGIRRKGLDCLPWTKELRNWQARVTYVQRMAGEHSDWPVVSDSHLLEALESWLAPYLNGMSRLSELKRMKLNIPLHALLTWKQQQALNQQAPTHITVPTGSRIGLDYCSQDIPILAVRLQEMFRQPDTPRLAQGKGQVLLHLLSPARRPIQVTQDLASFWKNGYQDVKKELKGRYPKHHWPDDPLQTQPTQKVKPAK
ncbi:MAG: ATP-dependent helicase HrpB [Nitrospirales bacterium]